MCIWGKEVGEVKQNLRLLGLGASCRETAGPRGRHPDASKLAKAAHRQQAVQETGLELRQGCRWGASRARSVD